MYPITVRLLSLLFVVHNYFKTLFSHVHLESDEEETDYNAAMKQLLGISKEPPPEFHENTDTESDVEQLLPTSGRIEKRAPPSWNSLNLNKSNVGMHAHALSRDLECIE